MSDSSIESTYGGNNVFPNSCNILCGWYGGDFLDLTSSAFTNWETAMGWSLTSTSSTFDPDNGTYLDGTQILRVGGNVAYNQGSQISISFWFRGTLVDNQNFIELELNGAVKI
jgi:hypothetical protein